MPPPWVIKYPSGGSSVGVSIARSFDDLANAWKKCPHFLQKYWLRNISKAEKRLAEL